MEDAPAYDPNGVGIHSIYLFERFSTEEAYEYNELAANSAALLNWKAEGNAELVACTDIVVDPSPTEICEYDLGSPLNTFGYTYTIRLYEAKTAQLVTEIPGYYASAPTCPAVLDVGITEMYPDPVNTYLSLLQTYVVKE